MCQNCFICSMPEHYTNALLMMLPGRPEGLTFRKRPSDIFMMLACMLPQDQIKAKHLVQLMTFAQRLTKEMDMQYEQMH